MRQANGDKSHRPPPLPGWQCVPLGKVGEIVSGVTLGRRLRGSRGRQVPYLRVANVKDAHLDLSNVYEIEASEEEIEKLRLRVGDLLLTEGGDADKLGRGTLWRGELPLCIHQNHIFRVRFDPEQFSPEFIAALIASPYGKAYFLAHAKQTTGIATINQRVLAGFPLIAPSLTEQQRIAFILREQMAAVERARAAVETRLEAAKTLPAAYLRAIFENGRIEEWPSARLDEVAELLPSKSISSTGDVEVRAITTACLSERGFLPTGVKRALMWRADADECKVTTGEVLVARSNTPELVGRVSMYAGDPPDVVASDLTIRIWPSNTVTSPFLATYLSYLYLTHYWTERAGGASGSMKKITREQLKGLCIPIPPDAMQNLICTVLAERMSSVARLRAALEVETAAIDSLSPALLHRAFHGGF